MTEPSTQVNITACPFQTQIGSMVSTKSHHQIIMGIEPLPLIKVQCDRERCQIWCASTNECAVSANITATNQAIQSLDELAGEIRYLASALLDILRQEHSQNPKP